VLVRMKPLTAQDFAQAKRLKVVAKQGVGVNTIDLAAARERGIVVCNAPGINSEAVAELALGLAIALARRIGELDRRIRAGAPIERTKFLGIELFEKSVGIIGMGNIGTRIARKFVAGFACRVVAYDPYVPAGTWLDIPHQRVKSLDELLPQADVLTIHVPLTPETRNMIGRSQLARMKASAILVNTSRGGIVDEAALYEALKAGRLFGAGLDVWEIEPPPADHPLLSLPNVMATPHAGGGTLETQERSSLFAAEQCLAVLKGGEPTHRVA
jgi:D-3-phosphoglycerate dehydrogenase